MAFPRKLLTDGEQILFEMHPHWKVLVLPAVWTILVWLVAIPLLLSRVHGSARSWIALLALVVWLLLVTGPMLAWRFTEYVLTNERLITRAGVIAKRSKEIPLETVNDITFTQSVLDRILRAGDLVLESAGEHGQEILADVADPSATQKRIYEATEIRKGVGAPRAGSGSVADELAKLADLRDRGVLTAEEFEARKRRLLES